MGINKEYILKADGTVKKKKAKQYLRYGIKKIVENIEYNSWKREYYTSAEKDLICCLEFAWDKLVNNNPKKLDIDSVLFMLDEAKHALGIFEINGVSYV